MATPKDSGRQPGEGIQIGGWDGDDFNFASVNDAGAVLVSGTTTSVPSVGAAAGATLVASTAYEASHVLKASAGTLVSLVGYNSKASAQFVQLYNSATVPADTAVPVLTLTVAATSNFAVDVPVTGMPFTTGIAVANSSTGPTKTIDAADCWFTAVVI